MKALIIIDMIIRDVKKREEKKVVQELLHSRYGYYVAKPEYSAFYKTKLESICSKEKIKELCFTGLSSGCCVYFSAAEQQCGEYSLTWFRTLQGRPMKRGIRIISPGSRSFWDRSF